jgi:hypothetical protein
MGDYPIRRLPRGLEAGSYPTFRADLLFFGCFSGKGLKEEGSHRFQVKLGKAAGVQNDSHNNTCLNATRY